MRLDGVTGALSALEVEDLVTLRDVATVLQRAEMVRRIADEIEGYVVELGDDGRLVALQLEELIGGVEDDRRLEPPAPDRPLDRPVREDDHRRARLLRHGSLDPEEAGAREGTALREEFRHAGEEVGRAHGKIVTAGGLSREAAPVVKRGP